MFFYSKLPILSQLLVIGDPCNEDDIVLTPFPRANQEFIDVSC